MEYSLAEEEMKVEELTVRSNSNSNSKKDDRDQEAPCRNILLVLSSHLLSFPPLDLVLGILLSKVD